MKISCAFAPSIHAADQARLAEELGFHRIWFADSPILYGDVWISLARAGEATSKIGLGTAVLVPHLRHVVATAAAAGTVDQIAHGRLALAFGTGFTARAMMGKKPIKLAEMEEYLVALKALLAGEIADVDGAPVKLIHHERLLAERPISVELLMAANGPKGIELTQKLGLGHMCAGLVPEGLTDTCYLTFGTVLEDDETPESPAVIERLAPALAVVYHGTYEAAGEGVDGLPGGAEWRAELEKFPEELRALYTHEHHLVDITDRDKKGLDASLVATTFSGTRDELRGRMNDLAASGVTEVVLWPVGLDTDRELRAAADLIG